MLLNTCLRAISTVLLFLSLLTVGAQDNDIKFHHLTVDNGLPSNTVNGVIRDSRGFIWIASENGISRYDAYTFRNFRTSEKDTISISSNITYAVFEDKKGRLWVGSEKGLDLYNRKFDRFDKHFFKGSPVRTIYEDSKNNLWIGSDDGLFQYDDQERRFIMPFGELFDLNTVEYNTVTSIIEDRNENLWVGTPNGVYKYENQSKAMVHFRHDRKDPESLSGNDVRKIIEDIHGQIWIATYGGGLNLYQPNSQSFKAFKHDINNSTSIASNLIPALWSDESGKIWIGTDGKGIDIFDPSKNLFHHVVHSPYNSKSLNNSVVRFISSDGRGGVWIGTYNGGVNFFNQNAEAFFHYKVPTINGNSSVTSFAEEKSGNLWIGTDGGGLCYFDRGTGQFHNFYHDERNSKSISDNRVTSLLLDDQGYLWIGTYLGGLCRLNPKTKIFTRYTSSDGSGLAHDVVWTLLKDSKNNLWVGTNNGLNVFNPSTNKFKLIDITNSNLSNNMVRCMYEDNRKRLWIGTQSGLNLYNDRTGNFIVIKSDLKKENSLSSPWIRTIHQDQQGKLWIGTFAGGLNLLHELTHTFSVLTESTGLPDNIVSGILHDHHNNLWISTGRGLACFDNKTKRFKSYTVSDGLQDNQFNINACFKTKSGEFLFGGNNGFTLFVPDVVARVESNKYPPEIALTSFKVFNKEVMASPSGSPLQVQVNEAKQITLSHDQTVLTFEFSALNFIRPEKNQYAYRLVGFEEEWNFVGNKRSATYTNLEPGDYTFQVKASNNDGVWNEEGISMGITINPPYWNRIWFKAMIAAIACIVVAFTISIVRNRIHEKIQINKLIAELELKALIAQMNPHFIFNCLSSIQELIIVHKLEDAMHYLHKFSKLLRTVLQCSEKNFISLEEELTLLELYLELESMRFDKQFHYTIMINQDLDPEEIIIPSFLLQPFVENALWHGLMHKKGDRLLVISFTLSTENILLCKISDNGIGRAEAARIKSQSVKAYHSMGIKIIKERINLMKKQNDVFDLQIIDETDAQGNAAGTTVLVKLPLGLDNDPLLKLFLEPKSNQVVAGIKKERVENI